MSPTPLPLRRRLGHGGLSLLVAATGTTLLWSASAGTAFAGPAGPDTECHDGTCVVTFPATGERQTFVVPTGVTSMSAHVSGASGATPTDDPATPSGGAGGRTTGTFAVQAGAELELVVGTSGSMSSDPVQGGAGGYGGGGYGGNALPENPARGAGGGGGSFVFDDETLLLAAGGGGAAGTRAAGGAGGAVGVAATGGAADGQATGGTPGTLEANGLAGTSAFPPGHGYDGEGGASSSTSLPTGGKGGNIYPGVSSTGVPGGGGGGGFHAGGGGGAPFAPVDEVGSGGGGGGGAGFAAPVVTDVFGQVGVQEGNGVITLIYALAPQIAFSTDAPTTAVVGGSSYEVKATGTGTADVAYSVDPATTNDSCTLDGTTVSFVHAGSCVIAADQAADPDHTAGHATQSITVGRATQTITFDPLDATGAVGGTAELKATGGASGLPVVLSSSDTTVCTVSGTTLTFVAKGTCTVTATQDGDDDHTAAAPVDQDVTVDLVATTTKLTFDEDTPVYGQEVTATATVTGATEGTVQLFVDGDASGDPVVLGTDGKADLPLPDGLGAGGYEVKAVFTPADTTRYAGSDTSATLPIGQARTKTELTVRSDEASVEVSAVAPGSGTPEGTVVFTVGGTPSAPVRLEHGSATLPGSVASGDEVGVEYGGDDDFVGSSDSTSREDPTITATVTNADEISPYGWYRTDVKVRFSCTEGSAPLSGDGCPASVTLSDEGAAQSVTRTVTAQDGGIATASVTGINIDKTAPQVSTLFGAFGSSTANRFFAGSVPPAGCVGIDELSGVWGCAGFVDTKGKELTYQAFAIDRAGNQDEATAQATVYNRGITDAPYANGVYTVRAGQSYTLVAKSTSRAQVLKPTSTSKKPTKAGAKFDKTGKDTWALGYTIDKSLKVGKTYNLGIKTGDRHSIKIHVVA